MAYKQETIKPYDDNGAKGQQVEQMFDNIAHSYDLLNHCLSLGIDKHWRKAAINSLKPYAPQRMLDVATGTGDFALLAARMLQPQQLIGIDISEGMLSVGRQKVKEAGLEEVIRFHKDDCMHLSLADASFDAVTVAYGIRNFEDLDRGLREMLRILRPGGRLVIIELKRDGLTYSPILELLRELRIQPSGFSKYCMGMALTDGELKKNCFKPRLRMISKMCRVDYDAPFIIQNL